MKQWNNETIKNGFTLLELLLYVSLASIMVLAVSLLLVTLLQSKVKNQTIAEVESQGIQVMQQITNIIRNAEGINTPAKGASANALSVDVYDAFKDPTFFDLSDGTIKIKEGAEEAVNLTNFRVSVTDLTFQNVSKNSRQNVIKFQFVISHINSSGRNEYDYSKTFYGTASVKK